MDQKVQVSNGNREDLEDNKAQANRALQLLRIFLQQEKPVEILSLGNMEFVQVA